MSSLPLVEEWWAAPLGTILFAFFGLTFLVCFSAKRFVETVIKAGLTDAKQTLVDAMQASLRADKPGLYNKISNVLIRIVLGVLESFVTDLIFRLWAGVYRKSPEALIYGALFNALLVGLLLTPLWLFVTLCVVLSLCFVGTYWGVSKGLAMVRNYIASSTDKLATAVEILVETSPNQ